MEASFIDKLVSEGLLRQGHFAFRSGRHSNGLIDRDLLLADPAVASHFGYLIAKTFFTDHVEAIATPSIWGAGLAQWVGYFLEPRAKVVDASMHDGSLRIAQNLTSLVEGRRVLVLDNLIISGQTMSQFLSLLKSLGATIIGVAALWTSSGSMVDGFPVSTLLNDQFPAVTEADCPLCASQKLPLETVAY